jgi:hypothetical protein
MALATTSAPLGSPKTYAVDPAVKRYTLMDLGFTKTKNGNFQLERSLIPTRHLPRPINCASPLKLTSRFSNGCDHR